MKEFKYTKYLIVSVCILLVVVIITHAYSFAKYTSNTVFSYFLNSKGFYFESEDLGVEAKNHIDTMWDGEKVYFTVSNSKSDDLTSSYDIEYSVSCTLDDDSNEKTCIINDTGYGTFTGILSASFGCVDKKNGKDVSNLDEETCKLDDYSWEALASTSKLYFQVTDKNGEEVNNAKVKITVTAKKPYTKTLVGNYTLIRTAKAIGELNVDYNKGEIFDDVLVSNSYNEDKCVKLSWNTNNYLIKGTDYLNSNLDDDGNVNEIIFKLNSMNSKRYEFYRVDSEYEYNFGDFELIESNECD